MYANINEFYLDNSINVTDAQKPMIVGNNQNNTTNILKMSIGQYYDKKEKLRERIVNEAKRLNLSAKNLELKFIDCKEKLTLSVFKRRMMDLGFMLTDFPDDDLVVLDADNDGKISHTEFIEFFKEGLKFNEIGTIAPPPEPPVDDLLFKPIDLAGELSVHIYGARGLKETTTWFNSMEKTNAIQATTTSATDNNCSTTASNKPEAMNRRYKDNFFFCFFLNYFLIKYYVYTMHI